MVREVLVYLVFLWASFGVRLGFHWASFGLPLGFLWASFGLTLGFRRFLMGRAGGAWGRSRVVPPMVFRPGSRPFVVTPFAFHGARPFFCEVPVFSFLQD